MSTALQSAGSVSAPPFHYNLDGSLDLHFQSDSAGKDKEGNWLPAPKAPFNLTMRLYSPQADSLTGKWNASD
jgi:hypothetical protein